MEIKQKRTLIAGGLALLLVAGIFTAQYLRPGKTGPEVKTTSFFNQVDAASVPADVADAAAKLATSRVGYAIVKPDKTYLIVSTGNPADKVAFDKAEGQPDIVNPTFVDMHFKASPSGYALQIGSTPLTSPSVEYQFNVDGTFAAIPTLHNRHNLPLIPLDAKKRFSMVTPLEGTLIGSSGNLHIEGYAQVFEASFLVTITTAKGRVIGQKGVHSAAGAPSWGSFVADIPFDTSALTETGFVILDEGMTGAKITIPVRFRTPGQMG
ncbi:MAG TPA: Gmad2 immunoglobulin-like domain-containing protein [Symbiobacteriaceae bacterium]|nr:Gmad2 immunoglobulin-like domain-containing protein [Symbiobacteriaceae bacterium]